MLSLHYYNNYCLIIPLFDYGDTVWGDKYNNTLMGQLQVLQNEAAKVLFNLPPRSSSTYALELLDLKTLSSRRHHISIGVLWCKNICQGKLILNLTSVVIFILIKLAKVMIYTFPVSVPVEASKLLFFKPRKTGTTYTMTLKTTKIVPFQGKGY